MRRRDFITAVAALVLQATLAQAQTYPSRPVHFIVGFPPGGTTDVVARLIGKRLSERFGVPFVVENMPGAGTNLATASAVRASADGHTLLIITPSNTINALFYDKLDFDFGPDIRPIATLIRSPFVLEVYPGFPAKTVPELIAYTKANPGKINLASFGTGTASHLSGEMFQMMSGAQLLHVPYKGSAPMLTDLMGGQVRVAFDNLPASLEHIRAGKLRALAVSTAARSQTIPEVPALAEFLPGFETSSWLAVGAPSKTASEIVDALNKEINAALADPGIVARLANLGATVLAKSPAGSAAFIDEETEKWRKVVRFSGAKSN
jgi:tripartite-type tricarboxylate transporter receptor subunit TctC